MAVRSIQKFRPYLTVQQLRYIVQLIEADNRSETEALKLRTAKELKLFLIKSDLGALTPAVVIAEKQSMTERLGLVDPVSDREEAYNLWSRNPMLCTEQQIKQARLYRYENDLMSPEEEAEYENTL